MFQRVVHKVFFWILVLRRFLLLQETLMNDTLTGMNLGKLKGLVFFTFAYTMACTWHFCCLFLCLENHCLPTANR